MKNISAVKYHMFFNIMYQIKKNSPEEYAQHMLFMCSPFRDEKELLSGNPPRYVSKLSENGVIET